MSLYRLAASAVLTLCVLAIAAVVLPLLVEHGGAMSLVPAVLLPFTLMMLARHTCNQLRRYVS